GLWEQRGGEQFDTGDKFSRGERHITSVGIANGVGKIHDQHPAAIWRAPVKLAFVYLLADTAPEDGALDPRAFEDLRQLRDMSKAIRHVANAHGFAKLGIAAQTELPIAQ